MYKRNFIQSYQPRSQLKIADSPILWLMNPVKYMVEMQVRAAKRSVAKIEDAVMSAPCGKLGDRKHVLSMLPGSRATRYRKLKRIMEREGENAKHS